MSEVDRAPLLEGTAPSATADGGDVDVAWISASSWSRISGRGALVRTFNKRHTWDCHYWAVELRSGSQSWWTLKYPDQSLGIVFVQITFQWTGVMSKLSLGQGRRFESCRLLKQIA